MPRKIEPAKYFSRVYHDIPQKLSASSQERLTELLGDNYPEFLPAAENLVGRYKNRLRIYNTKPKLGQIRIALEEYSEHAKQLSSGLEALDSDTFEFIHEVLASETFGEHDVSDLEGMDISMMDDPEAIEISLRNDSLTRWDFLQELLEQVEGEMKWLTIVVSHALSLVDKNSKPGPQRKPLHWLAEKTISGLRESGVEPLTATREGIIESVMRVILEESGEPESLYSGRDLLPEISKALQP